MTRDIDKPKAHRFKHVPERTRKGLFSPIEFAFTTRLSLDECVARFEQENERFLGDIQVELFPENSDMYEFTATSKGTWGAPTKATGSLRRWEGTATLVTGEAATESYGTIIFALGMMITLIWALFQQNIVTVAIAVLCSIFGALIFFVTTRLKSTDYMIDVIEYIVAPIQDPGNYPKRKRD
jgi:hypothetical protein